MNTKIIVGIIVLVAVVVTVTMTGKKDEMMPEKNMVKSDMVDKKDEAPMVKDEVATMKGSYEAYAPEKIALAKNGDVVIFFHASWCPSCRSLDSNLGKEISSIPDGVTILKENYDSSTELKKKYGVTSQHTLVQVDMDGNLIKKWSGGSTLQSVLAQIQ